MQNYDFSNFGKTAFICCPLTIHIKQAKSFLSHQTKALLNTVFFFFYSSSSLLQCLCPMSSRDFFCFYLAFLHVNNLALFAVFPNRISAATMSFAYQMH